MRGTSFFRENRLAARDTDKSYLVHRDMLNRIRQRQKSTMCKYSAIPTGFELTLLVVVGSVDA